MRWTAAADDSREDFSHQFICSGWTASSFFKFLLSFLNVPGQFRSAMIARALLEDLNQRFLIFQGQAVSFL